MKEKKYPGMENQTSNIIEVKEVVNINDEEPPSLSTDIFKKSRSLLSITKRNTVTFKEHIQESLISKEFYKKYFPLSDENDWRSWQWQIKHSIRSINQLSKLLKINIFDNITRIENHQSLPLRITPYYASLLVNKSADYALSRTVIPQISEYLLNKGELSDPLCENEDSPVPNIVHRYPDRVLFLVTDFCSAYCRYCTRSHMVAKDKFNFGVKELELAFKYIESHTEIRDVLLSGGDPLTLTDESISYILARLKKIKHIEFIRIGTKVPVVLPQRITSRLVNILKKYHPLWLSIHFTHPDEVTPEVTEACKRLANAGIPLGSQTVLLKNINDEPDVMKELMHSLLKIRVRPYYLYQCDPVPGSEHFRTSVEKGLEIIHSLRGFTSGYAVPHYVVDAPGGGGKIPLLPEYYAGREGNNILLRNYTGELFRYPDNCE